MLTGVMIENPLRRTQEHDVELQRWEFETSGEEERKVTQEAQTPGASVFNLKGKG